MNEKPTTKYVETEQIGGNGGSPFELFKEGQVLKSLVFYWDNNALRGITVTFTDKTTMHRGTPTENEKLLELGLDETITQLEISRNNYRNGRCSGVRIVTSKGKSFEAGRRDGFASTLDGGKAAGIIGRSGADIDKLGLIYTNDVAGYELKDVTYDLNSLKESTKPETAAQNTFYNRGDQPQKCSFSEEKTTTNTSSWSSTFGIKLGVKASGSAGVPLLAEGKWEISVETSFSYTWGQTVSESKKYGFGATVDVPPRSKVTCSGVLRSGKVDIPYKGTAVLKYEDGTFVESPESGIYEGVGAFDSDVDIGPAEPLEPADYDLVGGSSELVTDDRGSTFLRKVVVVE